MPASSEKERFEVLVVSTAVLDPNDPRIRDSFAYRYERIQQNGEELWALMAQKGFDPEPLFICCPACARVYGLYVSRELCNSPRSILDAYITLAGFLEEKEQCPRHIRTEIHVRSLLLENNKAPAPPKS